MIGSPPRIAADSIDRRFGGRQVLWAAYVDAVAGQITALVGVSGAGKTTLFEILVGRLGAQGGSIRWEGNRVDRPRLARLARDGLVYWPDHPWLSPRLTVGQQLQMAACAWGPSGLPLTDGIDATAIDRLPHTLSTGERRLAELAVCAACRPTVLVADEPFRGLEPRQRETVGAVFTALARSGTAILIADHDPQMVLTVADRLYSIEQGTTRPVPDFRTRPLAEWYHEWPG
ncbi:MAG TPA: ATP-binding cassette domain-containing protein [Mycobacteriales bacterium]|nr:ATP-binding cassette domain-containing protein [Mycobacteriales bacterium]